MKRGLLLPLGYGINIKQTGLDQALKHSFYMARQVNFCRSQRLNGEVASNQIQGAIKGSLGWIMKGMKEVNRDGRAIKDSQIQVSEENM